MNQIRVAMKTKVLLVVLFVFAQAGWTHADWPTAHGAPDNSGLARVDTVAAIRPIAFVDVGQIAPGANPVIGPDGTVYVGNLAGELIALHPDGKPYWKRNLNPEHGPIFASPAVGADGSIYVVSSMSYLDQRSGNPVHTAFLHKFLAGGAWAFSRTFPKASLYPFTDGGATTAPPNTWRWNGTEAYARASSCFSSLSHSGNFAASVAECALFRDLRLLCAIERQGARVCFTETRVNSS